MGPQPSDPAHKGKKGPAKIFVDAPAGEAHSTHATNSFEPLPVPCSGFLGRVPLALGLMGPLWALDFFLEKNLTAALDAAHAKFSCRPQPRALALFADILGPPSTARSAR